MKKIYLNIIFMFLAIAGSHAQKSPTELPDSSNYSLRKLKFEEINLVSAYYSQDGNNSAVTGGIGTEKLTDVANSFDLQMTNYNRKGKKNTFLFELGVDHYSSASSDKIDPQSISSASSVDMRIYPSLSWTQSNEQTGNSFGLSGSFSTEYDYQSLGFGIQVSRRSKDKNRQLDMKFQAFLDTWTVILPIELRETEVYTGPRQRNSFNASLSLSQVINQRLQAAVILDPSFQQGLLATKYQRNFFTDGSLKTETLPESRYKFPLAVRLNYFAGDKFIVRSLYRYYIDSWGISAHSAELELPVKLTSFFSVSPFYRYHTQQGAKYFAPYGQHLPAEQFFTSDYDLSTFHSNFFGVGLRFTPPKGVLGWQRLSMLELRYGHYIRSTSLASNIMSLNLKFK